MAKKIHWSVLGEKRGKLFAKIISFREEAEGRKNRPSRFSADIKTLSKQEPQFQRRIGWRRWSWNGDSELRDIFIWQHFKTCFPIFTVIVMNQNVYIIILRYANDIFTRGPHNGLNISCHLFIYFFHKPLRGLVPRVENDAVVAGVEKMIISHSTVLNSVKSTPMVVGLHILLALLAMHLYWKHQNCFLLELPKTRLQ